MQRISINNGWQLQEGFPSNIPGLPQKIREINLPHDFMIEKDVCADSKNGPNSGFYDGGTYTYTKKMSIPKEWEGKRALLSFDGVMGTAKLVVNGHFVCVHHYGYTPFQAEISQFLYYGEENRISVSVSTDNEQNARWYTGGGIYRNVKLLIAPKVHIAPYGVCVSTDHFVDGSGFVIVETTVENHTSHPDCCWMTYAVQEDGNEAQVSGGRIKVYLPANGEGVARTQLCIPDAKQWDINSPVLYRIFARLENETEVLDETDILFGLRTVSVDAHNGFLLNGRPLKLKGGCLHHDNGILGAVSFYDSEYRKLKLHKENGFNAVRTSHNPPSAAFLEACDRLGILVMEEAFDVWRVQKNFYDFTQYFEREWEQELGAMILRDRNHPSVVMWSIGNELPEQGGLSDGYETSAMLASATRRLDRSRPVCGALCSFFSGLDDRENDKFWQSLMLEATLNGGALNNLDGKYGREIWNDKTEAFAAPWDVVGYNYLDYHYKEAGQLFPNRVICCTESKPGQMEKYWDDVKRYPYLIGDFVWTSMDYIGEAGIGNALYVEPEHAKEAAKALNYARYPWRTAGCGDFDLCGFPRMQLPLRRILWGSAETYITVYDPRNNGKTELLGRYGWPECDHSWTWPVEEGTRVKVEVLSAAPEVELFLNGKSLGRKPARNRAVFELPYEQGRLEAVSLDGGREVSRDTVCSAGELAAIRLIPDKENLSSGGGSLCYVAVEFTDQAGNFIPYAELTAVAEVSGCAVLQGFGSARPKTEENYTVGKAVSYKGRLLAVIRSGMEPGRAILTVKSSGLPDAVLEMEVK